MAVWPFLHTVNRRSLTQSKALPESPRQGRLIFDFIQSIEFAETTKPALEVVDDRSRSKGIASIGADTRFEVDIMVDKRMLVLRIREIRLLNNVNRRR